MQDFEAWACRRRDRLQRAIPRGGGGEKTRGRTAYRWRGSTRCPGRPGWPGSPSSRCGSSSGRAWGRAARGSRDSTSSWSRPCGSLEPRLPARQQKKEKKSPAVNLSFSATWLSPLARNWQTCQSDGVSTETAVERRERTWNIGEECERHSQSPPLSSPWQASHL